MIIIIVNVFGKPVCSKSGEWAAT